MDELQKELDLRTSEYDAVIEEVHQLRKALCESQKTCTSQRIQIADLTAEISARKVLSVAQAVRDRELWVKQEQLKNLESKVAKEKTKLRDMKTSLEQEAENELSRDQNVQLPFQTMEENARVIADLATKLASTETTLNEERQKNHQFVTEHMKRLRELGDILGVNLPVTAQMIEEPLPKKPRSEL